MYKELFSAIAIILTFMALLPYLASVVREQIKPHVFSWIIWASTTFIVFLAQLADDAGVGAWPIGISGGITFVIAIIAFIKRGDISISKMDWGFSIVAMSLLPLWYFTDDPLWAVLILTTVDLLGFGPTFRKSYYFPHDEKLGLFALMAARNLISVLALENYSLTTLFFPVAVSIACIVFIIMVSYRRGLNKEALNKKGI